MSPSILHYGSAEVLDQSTGGKRSVLAARTQWSLRGKFVSDGPLQDVSVAGPKATIGRHPDNSLCITNPTVSGRHAEISVISEKLYLNDLKSTNGTFHNGTRVTETIELSDRDTVQFGSVALTVHRNSANPRLATIALSAASNALAAVNFHMLLDEAGVLPYFQPIVRLSDEQRVGFELLARSRLPGLEDPGKMFKAADARGQEVRLSEVIRMAGVFAAVHCELSGLIFLNTHPAELGKPELQHSLETLRNRFPDASLVIEVHEAAATSSAYLLELRKLTSALDIGLAYDDFGAGQSRLLELTEVPPDYVKFDMHLIRGLSTCSEGRRSMVATLVRAVHDLNVPALAEGVETQEEASICRDMGFDLAQGFFYGRPDAASTFVKSVKD